MKNIEDLKLFLEAPKRIVIVSHRNPDGDAVGSALGLLHFLKAVNSQHTIHVAVPSEFPELFNFLPGAKDILIHDLNPAVTDQIVLNADLIFCVDFNALGRIDNLGNTISSAGKPIVMIDHHLFPEDFADLQRVDISASSTCELVYEFIGEMGFTDLADLVIAKCLMTGILTDTGSFRYSTSPKLFRTVAQLADLGIDITQLQNRLFNSQTIKQLQLLGYCLNEKMTLFEEYKTGIIVLDRDDFSKFDILKGDTEGVVNYLLKMKAIRFAAFITESDEYVKLSFRSKGDFSVQKFAKTHFHGGGHKNAAGGMSKDDLPTTIQKFKDLLPGYAEQLNALTY